MFLPRLDGRRAYDEGREAPRGADRLAKMIRKLHEYLRPFVPNCAVKRHMPAWPTYSRCLRLGKGGGLRNVAIQIAALAQLRHQEKSVLVFVRGKQPWNAETAATRLELYSFRKKQSSRNLGVRLNSIYREMRQETYPNHDFDLHDLPPNPATS